MEDYFKKSFNDEIEAVGEVLDKNMKPVPFDLLDSWRRREWSLRFRGIDGDFTEEEYNSAPLYFYEYDEETVGVLKDAVRCFRMAEAYQRQIDKLFGGDIGEKEFEENVISNLKDIY